MPRLPPSQLIAVNAVDPDMLCFLPSACPVRRQFDNKCNDTVSLWLLLFYNFLVSFSNSCNDEVPLWLMWGTHSPKQFWQRVSCVFASTERLKCYRVTKAREPGENLVDTVPNKGHQCRCQPVTTVRQRFSSQFPSSSKFRSMSSVSSQCWWLKKLEPGRRVFKILRCGCCCVTTARKPLWLRLRFAARLSKACCSASIHNRSMTFSRVLDFC